MLGKHAGQHHRHPPDEGRRDRRLHVTEQMIKQFIKMGTRAACLPSPRIIICWCPAAPRRSSAAPSRNRRGAGASAGGPDRGTDGRRDRRRPARVTEATGLGGGRHRRRHHRSGRHPLGGMVYKGRCASAATSSTRHHQLHPPQLRHAGRRPSAERIKIEIGSRVSGPEVREMEVKGPAT